MSYYAHSICNSDETIDTRDVEKRIDELKGDLADLETDIETAIDECDTEAEAQARRALADWEDSDREELKALEALKEQAEGYCDWLGGATLINESHRKEYAQEYAQDTGAIKSDTKWPLNCIDWDSAAEVLFSSYTEVDFDGVTYYVN